LGGIKPYRAVSAKIGEQQTCYIVPSSLIRETNSFKILGHLPWFLGCGSMELTSGLIGMNLSMANQRGEVGKKSPRMSMHKYAECTVRIATKSGVKIATYFKCHAGNNWLKLLLQNSNQCNV
jgi:hypothetical protein